MITVLFGKPLVQDNSLRDIKNYNHIHIAQYMYYTVQVYWILLQIGIMMKNRKQFIWHILNIFQYILPTSRWKTLS